MQVTTDFCAIARRALSDLDSGADIVVETRGNRGLVYLPHYNIGFHLFDRSLRDALVFQATPTVSDQRGW